jgi:GcrA cell cycle regulator
MNWTDERVTELRGHFEAGLSASEIMRAMGLATREAVCGKLHRLGLKRGRPAARPDVKAKRRPRVARRAAFRPPYVPVAPPPPAAPAPAPAPPACQPIALLELTNATCRWPIGEGPYLFCGALEADLANGVSYCRFHSAMAYRRPGEREEGA